MSDLSWLNPTPHAIAVYASQPTSPLTTQHSLPSGRYSLLGPDFHRLDRTSFCLAHSFNHLVGAREHGWRDFQASRLRGLEVAPQLVLRRLLHRQVGRLLALEDTIHIAGRALVLVNLIRSVGGEAPVRRVVAERIDVRQAERARSRRHRACRSRSTPLR